ncbi:MAG TPA: TSUP family transporter, partial [Candidatus Angelobacter sp.]|nr:TSUP family transporter [Candidatus Angelobacter sp.]
MIPSNVVLLFCAATLAGAVNSVAGGGGFIAFPALLFTGMPSINANATNTVALWPGTLASTGAYRRALNGRLLKSILPLVVITFLGS